MNSLSLSSLKLRLPTLGEGALITVATVLLAVVLFAVFQNREESTQIEDLTNKIRQARVRLGNATNNSNVDQVRAQRDAASSTLASLKIRPFDSADVLLDLWDWASQYQVSINTSSLAKSGQTLGLQSYEVTDITLTITGALTDLSGFLTKVNAAPYRPVIANAKALTSGDGSRWTLDTKITLHSAKQGASSEATTPG